MGSIDNFFGKKFKEIRNLDVDKDPLTKKEEEDERLYRLIKAASRSGLTVISPKKTDSEGRHRYMLPCNHTAWFHPFEITESFDAGKRLYCEDCVRKASKRKKPIDLTVNDLTRLRVAENSGLGYIRAIRADVHEYIFVECGHVQSLHDNRITAPTCKICFEASLAEQSLEKGLELISYNRLKSEGQYKCLQCEKTVRGLPDDISRGKVKCECVTGDSSPKITLASIVTQGKHFLKLFYHCSSPDSRTASVGFTEGGSCSVERVLVMPSMDAAKAVRGEITEHLVEHLIPMEDAKEYLTSGVRGCYDSAAFDDIKEILDNHEKEMLDSIVL